MREFIEPLMDDTLITVMKWLGHHHPNSVLAGGAVRDALLGKDIKDFDIYVPDVMHDEYVRNEIIGLMGEEGYLRMSEVVGDYPEGDQTQLPRVMTFKYRGIHRKVGGKNIDFQFVFSNQRPYEFDISTCMAFVDTKWGIHTLPYFDMSVKNKKHYLMLGNLTTVEQYVISLASHLPRVVAKYPWPVEIIMPDDGDHLVADTVMTEYDSLRMAMRGMIKQMALDLGKRLHPLPVEEETALDVTSIAPEGTPWFTAVKRATL